MDPTVLAGLIFVLLLVILIGGFILLAPITIRLGRLLERRLEQQYSEPKMLAETQQLKQTIEALQEELLRVSQRQEFVESLLEKESGQQLPRGSDPAADR